MNKISANFRLLSIAAVLLLGRVSLADQVTLKNGDRVTGKIIKKESGALTFKSDVFGNITVPWDQIAKLDSEEPLTVVLPGENSLNGKITTSDSQLEVTTAAGQESASLASVSAIRNAEEQKAWVRLQHPSWLQLWSGYLDFGASLARGNADTTTVTTAVVASRTTRTDRTSVRFTEIYSTAQINGTSAATAQALRGGWEYSRNLRSRISWDLNNDYEYDKFQDLDLRFVVGSGLGYSFLKSERTNLSLVGGMAYTHAKFSIPLTRNSADFYWGDDWNYRLTGKTSFNQRFRMYNNLSQTGNYRMNLDVGLVTSLSGWLSLQLTYSDRYLSDPVDGRKKNDTLLTTGVRFTFSR